MNTKNHKQTEKVDLDWMATFLTINGMTLPKARKLIIETFYETIPSLVEFPSLKSELLLNKLADKVNKSASL